MIVAKTLVIGPALVAIVWASAVLDRSADLRLFVPRPVSANVAVVPNHPANDDAPIGNAQPTRLPRARDGLFYVRAKVNGVPVRFVLDTGATMVVLTPADASRIGLSRRSGEPSDSMETAGGVSEIRRQTVDRVEIAGHVVDNVDVAVVDNGLKASLLGQNLLARLGPITLSANEARLQ